MLEILRGVLTIPHGCVRKRVYRHSGLSNVDLASLLDKGGTSGFKTYRGDSTSAEVDQSRQNLSSKSARTTFLLGGQPHFVDLTVVGATPYT